MIAIASERWLASPPVTGLLAVFCGTMAVAVPAIIRGSLDGIVTGVVFTPFIPFVVLSAIFLAWKLAGAVALASAAVADTLFIGRSTALLEGPSNVVAVAGFLAASILFIAAIEGARRAVRRRKAQTLDPNANGIVFSLENGQVWASWYGRETPVHLGPRDEVAGMMEDFLAQVELGKQFTSKTH